MSKFVWFTVSSWKQYATPADAIIKVARVQTVNGPRDIVKAQYEQVGENEFKLCRKGRSNYDL